MAAVLSAAQHPAEFGPLVVLRPLDKRRQAVVDADDALASATKSSSDFFSSGSSNSTPSELQKQMASNCSILPGRNISMSLLTTTS